MRLTVNVVLPTDTRGQTDVAQLTTAMDTALRQLPMGVDDLLSMSIQVRDYSGNLIGTVNLNKE